MERGNNIKILEKKKVGAESYRSNVIKDPKNSCICFTYYYKCLHEHFLTIMVDSYTKSVHLILIADLTKIGLKLV